MSVLFVGVVLILSSFAMSASRLLNCFVLIENLGFLLAISAAVTEGGVTYLGLIVVFVVESALALVVLFRLWDTSTLGDVVGY